jgi:hypothetical protein
VAEDAAWVQTRGMQCQTASGGPESYPARDWVWLIAPSVPAQARREPVQHSASSPSSGRGCSARSSSLHSSAAHHLPRRWCCLCHLQLSLLGLSLSPLHPPLLPTISILLWLHHRACRSLGRSLALTHPLTRTRLHPRAASTSLFHPTASSTLQIAVYLPCLTYLQSSAVDLPLSVRQVSHLRHGVPPILCPAVKKRRPATLRPAR